MQRDNSNPSLPGESTVTEPGIIHPNGQTVQDQVIHRVFRVAADLDREPMYSEHPKCLSIREAKLNKRFVSRAFTLAFLQRSDELSWAARGRGEMPERAVLLRDSRR